MFIVILVYISQLGRVGPGVVGCSQVQLGAVGCGWVQSSAVGCGRVQSGAVECGQVQSGAVGSDLVRSCVVECRCQCRSAGPVVPGAALWEHPVLYLCVL